MEKLEKIFATLSTAASAADLLHRFRPRRHSLAATVLGYGGVFVAGVAVGAAAGLLLAPKSGRELRADLRSGARSVGSDLRTTASNVRGAARRVVTPSEVAEPAGNEAGAPH